MTAAVHDTEIRAPTLDDDRTLVDLDRRCWSPVHDVTDAPVAVGGSVLAERPEDFLVAEVGGRVSSAT